MKLKAIPPNTTVRLKNEDEIKKLFAVLHENGYKWKNGKSLMRTNFDVSSHTININEKYSDKLYAKSVSLSYDIGISLTEFEHLYFEGKSPQPLFKEGDMAIFPQRDKPLQIHHIEDGVAFSWWDNGGIKAAARLDDLTPYTEPETKPTEDMETKELNLCELIVGRDGIHVYCPTCGEVALQAWDRRGHTKPLIFAQVDTSIVIRTFANGKAYAGGECCIFPSRALYEQYPLDPYSAWMKWQEEQKKPFICIHWGDVDCNGDEEEDYTGNTYFRTSADRDKCVEEINAIIEKYSMK